MAGVTGVPTPEYAPYYLFAFLSPPRAVRHGGDRLLAERDAAADRAPAADEPAVATDDD